MKALKFYKELKESEPSTSSRESEVASADEEAARKYPEKLAKIIKDGEYCAHQVFNADETGLFWKKCQPVLTLQSPKKLPVVLKLLKIELLYCCAAMHLAIEC
ncbi:hypothetical protein TNCV_3722131 [Trichonephila clavipes]|nr:hypothetical protein TNCV_4758211 [Trichonephila clavipes]GFW25485.1 hypothetical protein TNCV_3722131 [Trichonephila clavipes]